jgi:hypothetical protein
MIYTTYFVINIILFVLHHCNSNQIDTTICPKYCKCNLELKLLKCIFNPKDKNSNNLKNKSLINYNEIQLKNANKITSYYFNTSKVSKDLRLKIFRPVVIESNAFNSNEIKQLEIIYTDLKIIEENAFANMKCDLFSLISYDKNYQLNLNQFSSNTYIKTLSIDHNYNLNNIKSIFSNNNFNKTVTTNLTLNDLETYWTFKSSIKNLFIKDVRSIDTLDYTWAPRFETLDRIEISRTDIRFISKYFTRLHSKSLKYLTISKSKIVNNTFRKYFFKK